MSEFGRRVIAAVKEMREMIDHPWLFKEYYQEPTCTKTGLPIKYIKNCDCKNCKKER